MKSSIFIIMFLVISGLAGAQTIKRVSAYDNNYDNSSGIFGITDHAVYEYSWYQSKWLQLPTTGLSFVDSQAKIDEISAFDSNSLNPSGVYVISDTAVYVYNYYAQRWYALYNNGLCRIDGKVHLTDLSAHLEVDNDYERIYVKSCDHIYYYNWYAQNWGQLTNDGLTTKTDNVFKHVSLDIFPNPVSLESKIVFTLPEEYSGEINVFLFDNSGKFIKQITKENMQGGEHQIQVSTEEFSAGIYYFEISGVNFSQAKKFIKL